MIEVSFGTAVCEVCARVCVFTSSEMTTGLASPQGSD